MKSKSEFERMKAEAEKDSAADSVQPLSAEEIERVAGAFFVGRGVGGWSDCTSSPSFTDCHFHDNSFQDSAFPPPYSDIPPFQEAAP